MCKLLCKKPKSYEARTKLARYGYDLPRNAYVFGRKYPAADYEHVTRISNDGAQVGFVLYDAFMADPDSSAMNELILREWEERSTRGQMCRWDNRELNKAVRAIYPYVLFVGDTLGGDVGADLYVHRASGAVDSVMVDNAYFFPPAEGD